MNDKIKASAATALRLPLWGAHWREGRKRRRVCALLLLCGAVGLLFCAAAPSAGHTATLVAVTTSGVPGLDTLHFADATFSRAQQTTDWRYDAQWARDYPGVATYRSGDNFVSCGTLATGGRLEAVTRVLLKEGGLDFVRQTEEAEALQCYAAPLDGAHVLLYLCAQDSGAGATLAWAQAYIAAASPREMAKATVSVSAFVHTVLQSGAEQLV